MARSVPIASIPGWDDPLVPFRLRAPQQGGCRSSLSDDEHRRCQSTGGARWKAGLMGAGRGALATNVGGGRRNDRESASCPTSFRRNFDSHIIRDTFSGIQPFFSFFPRALQLVNFALLQALVCLIPHKPCFLQFCYAIDFISRHSPTHSSNMSNSLEQLKATGTVRPSPAVHLPRQTPR